MSGISNVGGAQPINMISLEGLDLESMIMAVQTNRVNVLDEQIKSKMEVVQARNVRINELNANMSGMNAAIAKCGTAADAKLADAGATAAFLAAAPRGPVDPAAVTAKEQQIANQPSVIASAQSAVNTAQQELDAANSNHDWMARIWMVPTAQAKLDAANAALTSANAATTTLPSELAELKKGSVDPKAAQCANRGQAEAYVKSIQTQIDSLGNTQQMDMLNLQSLSNKRNEAFEIMTNFMKKFNDSRAGIIQKF